MYLHAPRARSVEMNKLRVTEACLAAIYYAGETQIRGTSHGERSRYMVHDLSRTGHRNRFAWLTRCHELRRSVDSFPTQNRGNVRRGRGIDVCQSTAGKVLLFRYPCILLLIFCLNRMFCYFNFRLYAGTCVYLSTCNLKY